MTLPSLISLGSIVAPPHHFIYKRISARSSSCTESESSHLEAESFIPSLYMLGGGTANDNYTIRSVRVDSTATLQVGGTYSGCSMAVSAGGIVSGCERARLSSSSHGETQLTRENTLYTMLYQGYVARNDDRAWCIHRQCRDDDGKVYVVCGYRGSGPTPSLVLPVAFFIPRATLGEHSTDEDPSLVNDVDFNLEEISSGSPTTHSDSSFSLPDYKAFYIDNDHFKEKRNWQYRLLYF
ncbi:hypothetical protein Tco_0098403 [Tanacetum coccineum]